MVCVVFTTLTMPFGSLLVIDCRYVPLVKLARDNGVTRGKTSINSPSLSVYIRSVITSKEGNNACNLQK